MNTATLIKEIFAAIGYSNISFGTSTGNNWIDSSKEKISIESYFGCANVIKLHRAIIKQSDIKNL